MDANRKQGRKRQTYGQKVYLVLEPDGLSSDGVQVRDVKLTKSSADGLANTIDGGRTKKMIATK